MSEQGSDTRECPYCREEVKAEAVRCKHCHAAIRSARPDHEGVCPLCKEEINAEAIRCKHCQADLAPVERLSPSCKCSGPRAATGSQPASGAPSRVKRLPQRTLRSRDREASEYEPCTIVEFDEQGAWCLVHEGGGYCYYTSC